MRLLLALTAVLAIVGSLAGAADQPYERRFSDLLASGVYGFVSDPALVDTNNAGPTVPSAPLSFPEFSKAGQFLGIKLGMTMSEVVAAWGKPRGLYTRCGPGPRFYYSHSVSLSFRDERLVRIALGDQILSGLVFDNGLKATMGSTEVGALIGSSLSRREEEYFLSYACAGGHLDFGFHHVLRSPTSAWQKEELSLIILGRGDETKVAKPGEQGASECGSAASAS